MLEEWFNFSYFYGIFLEYWWNVLYIVLYVGCVLYLFCRRDRILTQIFAWPFLIFLATIFNPLVMEPVLEILGWRDRYNRFYWMLPVTFLCAFFAAKLVVKQKQGAERNILVLFLLCLLTLCGGSTSAMELDDNIYKVDDSIIAVADMIEEHADMENPIVLWDAEMYYWIRQYDPALIAAVPQSVMDIYRFRSADEIDKTEQEESKKKALSMFARGVEIDIETANELLEEKNVDYFVRNVNYYSDFYLDQLNLSYVDAVDGYELYRCIHD